MRERDPSCLFCRIVAREIPSQVVLDDGEVLAFKDLHPVAPLHVLVVPTSHVASAATADRDTLGAVAAAAARVARDAGYGDRFRLVANTGAQAGQSVDHLHFHVLAGRSLGWPPG